MYDLADAGGKSGAPSPRASGTTGLAVRRLAHVPPLAKVLFPLAIGWGARGGSHAGHKALPTCTSCNAYAATFGSSTQLSLSYSFLIRLKWVQRGGGGSWNPKVCVPKMAQINMSFCKFHFFPGGNGCTVRARCAPFGAISQLSAPNWTPTERQQTATLEPKKHPIT